MRDTRWDETKVFARIASLFNILLGFFYLGGTKVQKGDGLFPNPFRDSSTHPAMRLDSGKALAERTVPRSFHSSHLVSFRLISLYEHVLGCCCIVGTNGSTVPQRGCRKHAQCIAHIITCCVTDRVPRRPSLLSGVSASWRLGGTLYCEVAFTVTRSGARAPDRVRTAPSRVGKFLQPRSSSSHMWLTAGATR